MRALVHSASSPDIGPDPLSRYEPEVPDLFSVYLQFEIGPSDGDGAEVFGLTVCSPRWLLEHERPKGFEFVQATLVMDKWDASLVERAVSDLCVRAPGADWTSTALSLSRFLRWEFADYDA